MTLRRVDVFYKNNSGLINRLIVCWCAGIVLLFILNIRNYDLHFTWRGPQKVSSEILVAHIPNDVAEMREAIFQIEQLKPKLMIAPVSRRESHFMSEFRNVVLIPRKGFKPESDGIIRSLKVPQTLIDNLQLPIDLSDNKKVSLINFRGPQNTFPPIFFYEIKNQKILPSAIQDKIVILNLQDQESEPFATPVGDMSPAEILANMIDNILLNRWITPTPFWISSLFMLLLTGVLAVLILKFSANLAFIGIFITLLFVSSLSFLLFDHFYLWLPFVTFVIQIFISYLVFVNFKLEKKEQVAWRLEKESTYQSEMDEMKKNFLNLFSHDLKTPIAKVLGQIDIMEGQMSNVGKIKEGFLKIRRYSHELDQYVKSILKISQIESDGFRVKREPGDMNSIIEQAISIIAPLAEEKDIRIDTKLEPLFSIKCDKELVQQIVLNLLENAIKYSPIQTTVTIDSKEEDDFVVVTVTDQGKGIKAQDQELIWKKFSRLKETAEGTGLGLYLVKYFVEAHNGAVFMKSEENKGTTIGFKLPLN
jgi:two-component system, OmpR family, phosphate regulon sensor histidine kinase PhoR